MATIVIATLIITAALRKLAPRIDGPWIVLVVACVVGVAWVHCDGSVYKTRGNAL